MLDLLSRLCLSNSMPDISTASLFLVMHNKKEKDPDVSRRPTHQPCCQFAGQCGEIGGIQLLNCSPFTQYARVEVEMGTSSTLLISGMELRNGSICEKV
jgi:hypothetical protein